jgi:hypothetical protein
MDLRHAPVLGEPPGAAPRDHVEPELAVRSGPATFRLGTIPLVVPRAGRIDTAPHLQPQPDRAP